MASRDAGIGYICHTRFSGGPVTFRTWRELTITSGRGPARHRSCQPNL